MDFDQAKNILEVITSVITILGVPVGIYLYVKTKIKERRDREYLTYDSLDDKHMEFLNLCLQYSELNIYWDRDIEVEYSRAQKNQRLILFEILLSILERAYLLYRTESSIIRKAQWVGWHDYIVWWMESKSFQDAWDKIGSQYDEGFLEYMNDIRDQMSKTIIPENKDAVLLDK